MITFDKIKIITKLDYITITNDHVFEKREKNNKEIKTITLVFKQIKPYSLYIEIIPEFNKVIIEFTGKILLEDYPKLISFNTIFQCFQNINNLGFCELQIDKIVYNSELVKVDLTKDIYLVLKTNIKKILISQLTNYNKYHIQKYLTGYIIWKDVKTNKYKLRLSIYNKSEEMHIADNSDFLNSVDNSKSMLNYFENKYRIEANLITKEQIRRYLNIMDNSLISALQSVENPLLKIFNTIFDTTLENADSNSRTRSLYEYDSLNQLKDGLILKACSNDLCKAEKLLNHYLAEKSTNKKYRTRLRKLINESIPETENKFVVGQMRDQLIAS